MLFTTVLLLRFGEPNVPDGRGAGVKIAVQCILERIKRLKPMLTG
jgi:hypothetical protein